MIKTHNVISAMVDVEFKSTISLRVCGLGIGGEVRLTFPDGHNDVSDATIVAMLRLVADRVERHGLKTMLPQET